MSDAPLNDRTERVLHRLVAQYIADGQPVSSKALAGDVSIELGSASIRNIMAELEGRGYLHSPHTSAGRVPTSAGYRLFVNKLLLCRSPGDLKAAEVAKSLNNQSDINSLVGSASTLLSQLSKLAGVVTVPSPSNLILKQVEFLPLSDNRVLAILVLKGEHMQNRILQTTRKYSASELQQAANFISQHYAGLDLAGVRKAILQDMRRDKANMEHLMQTVMDMSAHAFDADSKEDYILAGESNLVNIADFNDVSQMESLFEAFSEKRGILHLLDQCMVAEELQIFIGDEVCDEAGDDNLSACSVVTAPYSIDGKQLGVLGVIGPTRMNYERAIVAVDMTAKLLSAALKG